MTSRIILSLCAVLLAVSPDVASGQDTTGTFDDVASRVRRGQTLIVTTETGERIRGRLVSASVDSLIVSTGRDRRELTPPDVSRIAHRDSTVLSIVIGAGAGFLAGWAVAAAECRVLTLPEIFDDCSDRGSFRLAKTALVVLPAAGALIGWALDASHNATVYQRRAAIRVSVSTRRTVRAAEVRVAMRF